MTKEEIRLLAEAITDSFDTCNTEEWSQEKQSAFCAGIDAVRNRIAYIIGADSYIQVLRATKPSDRIPL